MLRCPFFLMCPLLILAVVADAGQGQPVAQDLHGDPLPAGALARMGTVRFRHGGNVSFVAFLPDDNLLTAGNDGTARLWSPAGKELRRFNLPQQVEQAQFGRRTYFSVAVSADGKVLAANDGQQGIRLWDVASVGERKPIQVTDGIQALALSPDGKAVAATGAAGVVTVWDTTSGKERGQFNRPPAQAPAAGGGRGFGGFSAWK